ncbi:MAG TPA: ABC transporter substrate-binding protein [Acidimicrobiales bacterium]|nr:ABC transporter substrate-binding protein [Acidimicrobiales bacterium]
MRHRRALVALALLVALGLGACTGSSGKHAASSTSTTVSSKPVRIGVWTAPDPNAATYGGVAVRELVYPQLFRATPAGRWAPSLVKAGTDKTDPGATSARFRLRPARWSNGSAITAADLRRSLDGRFVSAVDDPTPDGTIVVHFFRPLPGWRRLWSGLDTVAPPADGVYGGPYKVQTVTPGLETVLVANATYFGAAPAITEVHLVLAPDPEIAARLMERGDLDVIAPPAFTGRLARLERIKDAHVVEGNAAKGGWTAAFVANPTRLDLAQRRFLFHYANGPRFTDVLLHDEAASLGPATTADAAAPKFKTRPSFALPDESAPAGVLLHAMQRTAHKGGFDFDVRSADFDRVLGSYAAADYDVLFRLEPSLPAVCWTCRYATIDAMLAQAADSGDAAAARSLRAELVDQAYDLPLWREVPAAAVRDGLDGVTENGFDVNGPAWNVAKWHWTR